MAVPILGAVPAAAPTFTLRVHRNDRATMVEVIRDSDSVTVAIMPFANELWDQLFHTHEADEHPPGCDCTGQGACAKNGGVGARDPEQIAGRDDV